MPDLVERARAVVGALERNDLDAVSAARSERLRGWSPDPWIRESWMPRLAEVAGSSRRITDGWQVHDRMARFTVEGDRGRAFVTVLLEEDGLFGLAISEDVRDGRFGINIGCGDEQRDALESFWRRLVRAPLGFGEGVSRAPRWPDPAYPQQIHLDVLVPDLSAAEAEVLANGAVKLRDSGSFRVYADPVGHPFCLYADPSSRAEPDRTGVLGRVVIDCPSPETLATFWGGLLDMPTRVENSPDRVVVAREDGTLPMIGLQRVEDYRPPKWPDPQHPAQLHFDISFDHREAAERRALQLGATRLPPQGGSCPVYADPAGHPFCLCMTGE